MEKINNINYLLVQEAFEREGWTKYHIFMAGNKWVKGKDMVTCFHGGYKLNGEPLSNEHMADMLHIDRRAMAVCEAIAPHEVHGAYGRAFLAGVRWADQHPIKERKSELNSNIFQL